MLKQTTIWTTINYSLRTDLDKICDRYTATSRSVQEAEKRIQSLEKKMKDMGKQFIFELWSGSQIALVFLVCVPSQLLSETTKSWSYQLL